MDAGARLAAIHERVGALMDEYSPDAVAVEDLYFGANARSAFAVGQARGVVVLAAGQRGVRCASYTPQQVKGAVCGSGRAAKDQVQRMVQTLLTLPELPRPDHAADALAVAICHANGAPMAAALRGGADDRARSPARSRCRRADHVVVSCGGVGYRLAVSAETLRHVPRVGEPVVAAHPPDRARRRAAALRLRHRGGARPVPAADRRPVRRPEDGARGALRRPAARAAGRRRGAATPRACRPCPGIGKRTAERIIVELREKVGVPDAGRRDRRSPAATTRARSPATGCSGSASRSRRPRRCCATRPATRPRT